MDQAFGRRRPLLIFGFLLSTSSAHALALKGVESKSVNRVVEQVVKDAPATSIPEDVQRRLQWYSNHVERIENKKVSGSVSKVEDGTGEIGGIATLVHNGEKEPYLRILVLDEHGGAVEFGRAQPLGLDVPPTKLQVALFKKAGRDRYSVGTSEIAEDGSNRIKINRFDEYTKSSKSGRFELDPKDSSCTYFVGDKNGKDLRIMSGRIMKDRRSVMVSLNDDVRIHAETGHATESPIKGKLDLPAAIEGEIDSIGFNVAGTEMIVTMSNGKSHFVELNPVKDAKGEVVLDVRPSGFGQDASNRVKDRYSPGGTRSSAVDLQEMPAYGANHSVRIPLSTRALQ